MPLAPGIVHVDAPLTNFALEYGNTRQLENMITKIITDQESDQYAVIEQTDFLRIDAVELIRADASISAYVDLNLEFLSFKADEYALHTVIGARTLKAQHPVLKLLQRAAVKLSNLISLEFEFQIFTLLTTDANYSSGFSVTLTNGWDDAVNGDPIGDLQTSREVLIAAVGGMPPGTKLKLGLPLPAFHDLQNHPQFLERHKYTSGGNPDITQIGDALGVDEMVVSMAALGPNSITPGSLNDPSDNALLWPISTDQASLAIVADGLGGAAPGVGDFTAFGAFMPFDMTMRRWSDSEQLANAAGPAQFVESSMFWDLKTVAVDNSTDLKTIAARQIKNTRSLS